MEGQWEEGITGTTMKDTWRKSRGRVEAEEGGGEKKELNKTETSNLLYK